MWQGSSLTRSSRIEMLNHVSALVIAAIASGALAIPQTAPPSDCDILMTAFPGRFSSSCCQAGHITCDSNNNIIYLLLDYQNLTGKIPTELSGLKKLQALTLMGNNLSGEIPDIFGNFTDLNGLWLSINNLDGMLPPSVLYHPKLDTLYVRDNPNLVGTIGNDSLMLPSIHGLYINNTGIFLANPLASKCVDGGSKFYSCNLNTAM